MQFTELSHALWGLVVAAGLAGVGWYAGRGIVWSWGAGDRGEAREGFEAGCSEDIRSYRPRGL